MAFEYDRPPVIVSIRDADFGLSFLPWWKGQLHELREADHHFQVLMPDGSIREYWIPEGYQFDKASIPPVMWGPPFFYTPDGCYTLASLEHDWLCDLLAGAKGPKAAWIRSKLLGRLPEAPPPSVIHQHFQRRLLEMVRKPGQANGMTLRRALVMGQAVMAFGPRGWAWAWLRWALLLTLLSTALYYLFKTSAVSPS